MRFLDEYRDAPAVQKFVEQIRRITTKSHTIMEICGGQTHAIVKFGIDELLPREITLVHGPGCPVCVTPLELIDKAIKIASLRGVVFCSFGDMLRVPGSQGNLFSVKAQGGDVRVVYSPLDAVKIAQSHPSRQVVFFAVGFETTAPANAMAVLLAEKLRLKNFFMLVSHVLVPPAIKAILSSPLNRVQGFLAAGHVCVVMGYRQYESLVKEYHIPIVVTGFEPLDLLQGIYMCIKQLEEGRAQVENQYSRVVHKEGNTQARKAMEDVFVISSRTWRGVGEIPQSGLALRKEYRHVDAERKFHLGDVKTEESRECISGLILQGQKKPYECCCFGAQCTPEHPLGATMVSSEGACAAYFKYRRIPQKI